MENSRDLTLSWYRGRDILKKTSSPDLSTKLSLALEIDSKDGGGYSCVAENPVEEKVVRLHAKDTCQDRGMMMCGDGREGVGSGAPKEKSNIRSYIPMLFILLFYS